MRIERLRVGAYGPLAELELTGLGENDLVVVYGPNEAGKSSLRAFVGSMLYGFSPAAREDHPATPADGHAHGELELALADGSRVRVERHLRARPSARAWRGEAQEELANRPLAEVAWLERGTYLALHAIDADELRGLDATTWREIEQRLLGGASPAFLRPAALAAGELSAAADALWRSDRRGKPRSTELSAQLAVLREARREALAGAQAHDETARELARVREALALARREEARLDGRRDLHDRHAPALRAWQELERLRAEAEELVPEPLAARVGAQPGERLEALRAELDERRRELADVRAELETAQLASRLGEREMLLIEHAAAIREAALARARDEGERGQLVVERARAESQASRSDELASRVLGHPLRDPDEAALESVQIADLQAAATRCERAMPAASARVAHVPAVAVGAAAALACMLAALAAAGIGPRLPPAVGALLAAFAALGLVRARKGTRTMRAALAERSAGGSDLVAALGELRVAESRIAHPDHTLVSDIEQLRALTRERALATRRLAQLVEAELQATERGASLAAVLGTDDSERLSQELEAAQRRDAQATAAGERAGELMPRAAAAAERSQGAADRLAELERLVLPRRPWATRPMRWSGCMRPPFAASPPTSANAASSKACPSSTRCSRRRVSARLAASSCCSPTTTTPRSSPSCARRAPRRGAHAARAAAERRARAARCSAHGRRRGGRAARGRGRARSRAARARPPCTGGRHRAPRRARGARALRPSLAAGGESLPGGHHARPLHRHRDRGDARRRAGPRGHACGRADAGARGPPLSAARSSRSTSP